MRPIRTLAGLLGLSALILGSQTASACSCLPSPPPLEALDRSTAVFAGRVVEIRAVDEMRLVILFDVERSWKGVSGRRVVVWTPGNEAACGVHFTWGERYVVYTGDSEGLSVYLCSRTAPLQYAEADIEALGEGQEASPLADGSEGDLTGDRKVDLADAARSLQIAVGAQPSTPANEVSGDGLQTLADTVMVLRQAVGLSSRFPISRVDPYCGEWRATQRLDENDPASRNRRLVLEGRCTFPSAGYGIELNPAEGQTLNSWIYSLDKILQSPAGSPYGNQTEVPVRYEEESSNEYILLTLLPDKLAVMVPPAF